MRKTGKSDPAVEHLKPSDSLQALQNKMWLIIREVSDRLPKCEEPTFAEVGVSPQQCTILLTVANSERPPAITSLAKTLRRNINTTSAMIDRMERLDLVKRVKDVDGRGSRIELTTTGSRIADLAIEKEAKLIKRLLGNLTPAELESCLGLMEAIKTELILMSDQRGKRMSDLSARQKARLASPGM